MKKTDADSVKLKAVEINTLEDNVDRICSWKEAILKRDEEKKQFDAGLKERGKTEAMFEIVTLISLGMFLLFRGAVKSGYTPFIDILYIILIPSVFAAGGFLAYRCKKRKGILGFLGIVGCIALAGVLMVLILSASSKKQSVNVTSLVFLVGFIFSFAIWQVVRWKRMAEFDTRGRQYLNSIQEERERWQAIDKTALVIIPPLYWNGDNEKGLRAFVNTIKKEAVFGNKVVEYAVSAADAQEKMYQ